MAADEKFALKVATMQTAESLVKLAKSEGVIISEEQAKAGLEKINSLAQEGKTLNDDELDELAVGYKHRCKPIIKNETLKFEMEGKLCQRENGNR